jgi:hypothetical protein
MGSPGDSYSTAELGNCYIIPGEEDMTYAAKRKRQSAQLAPRQTQCHNYLQKSPSLFISGSPFKSLHALGPTEESLARIIDGKFSSMDRDELPVVTEFCFRVWPFGPYAFHNYQYAAMIKTDPDQRKLSDSRIAKLINGMGYTWKIDDIAADTLSPDWTRVDGHIIDPSEEASPAPILSGDSSSNSSDDDSDDDSDPNSDHGDSTEVEEESGDDSDPSSEYGGSSEAEEDHELEKA